MNRTNLLKAVESSATANGYHFYTGDEHYIPQLATAYPALWLNPPKFQSIEGRTHGNPDSGTSRLHGQTFWGRRGEREGRLCQEGFLEEVKFFLSLLFF